MKFAAKRSAVAHVADLLVDANVLIDLLHGLPAALELAQRTPLSSWLLHPIVEAECLMGANDREHLKRMQDRLALLRSVRVAASDFDHCLAFVRRYSLSDGVGWPDCLVAATAQRIDATVVTLNLKHFRAIRGLKVVRPY